MKCPHCSDLKDGEFPGIGVRCRSCGNSFYAGRDGIGYLSPPWRRWLLLLVVPLAGGGVVWGLSRFLWAGDFVQVRNILLTLASGLALAEVVRRFSTLPEV